MMNKEFFAEERHQNYFLLLVLFPWQNQHGEDAVKKIKGVFVFKVKKGGKEGVWVVDMKTGKGSVRADANGKVESWCLTNEKFKK